MSINKQLGGVSDFIRIAETQTGNQATDLEFTNTFGGATIFIMRGDGSQVSGSDLVNLNYVGTNYYRVQNHFNGNGSSSIDASTNSQVFNVTIDSGYKIKNGTIECNVNGVNMISNTDQINSGGIDFYMSASATQVCIRKLYTNGNGMNLDSDDLVNISYQQEKI